MNNENEMWKDIPGYESLYKINNIGIVKSLERFVNNGHKDILKKEKIRKNHKNKDGYLFIRLSKNGITKGYSVHRLVAQAFIPNPNNYPEINHIDGNKLNNAISNLEWCNRTKNVRHSFELGLNKGGMYGKYGKNHHSSKKVAQYDLNNNFISSFESATDSSQRTKVDLSSISKCCLDKQKTAGGYKWKYID